MNSLIGGAMTKKARVIEIPQCEQAAAFEDMFNNEMSQNVWVAKHAVQMMLEHKESFKTWGYLCDSVIGHPGLIEQLKEEKFDAAFTETFDFCGPVIFHLAGIDNWAITESVALRDGGFQYTQTPSNPAYVPTMMSGSSDAMSFFGRLSNTFSYLIMDFFMDQIVPSLEEIMRRRVPDLPSLKEISSTNSLVFFNAEPLVDFPKLTSARIIDIGGITVSSEHVPLNKTWSDILDLRPSTILLSFGTIAKAFAMPEEYKQTIRETFRKFPNVTFIWKYQKPEHKISEGVPNLIESTWVPQRDMLHDPRLTAFITHCGQGSTTESIDAGIPLIVIPVMGDQTRNAYQVERNGIGLRLDKTDLANVGKLEAAIREILSNESYRENALKVKSMVADRPFAMKEIFVKNMEFLAKHGPLRQLDHYGRHLSFVQYYLIDVIAFVVFVVVAILARMYTRNDLLHLTAHFIVDSLAVAANIILLIAIKKRTPQNMRAYSILITITAIVDTISAISGFLACSRLMNAPDDTSIFVFLGPCSMISRKFCLQFKQIPSNQSTWLILLSFCYRLYALKRAQNPNFTKSTSIIWAGCTVSLMYSALSIYIYCDIAEDVPPEISAILEIGDYVAISFPRVDTLRAAAAILPTALISPTLTFSIYFIRRILINRIQRSIVKERAAHNNFAKTLTYQSLLPIGGFIGTTYWSLDKYFALSSEFPQRLVMIINPIPLASPIINLLCLPSYKKWLMSKKNSSIVVSIIRSTSNGSSER